MRVPLLLAFLFSAPAFASAELGEIHLGSHDRSGDTAPLRPDAWCGWSSVRVKNDESRLHGDRVHVDVRIDRVRVFYTRANGDRETKTIAPSAFGDDLGHGQAREFDIHDGEEVCINRVQVEGGPIDRHGDRLGHAQVVLEIRGAH